MDSQRTSIFNEVPKFIEGFLEDTDGVDAWRLLYPHIPGFTYQSARGSFSRIDYFLLSSSILAASQKLKMRIAEWREKLDHAQITLTMQLLGKSVHNASKGKPWSIPQPRLFNLSDVNRSLCKSAVHGPLESC